MFFRCDLGHHAQNGILRNWNSGQKRWRRQRSFGGWRRSRWGCDAYNGSSCRCWRFRWIERWNKQRREWRRVKLLRLGWLFRNRQSIVRLLDKSWHRNHIRLHLHVDSFAAVGEEVSNVATPLFIFVKVSDERRLSAINYFDKLGLTVRAASINLLAFCLLISDKHRSGRECKPVDSLSHRPRTAWNISCPPARSRSNQGARHLPRSWCDESDDSASARIHTCAYRCPRSTTHTRFYLKCSYRKF